MVYLRITLIIISSNQPVTIEQSLLDAFIDGTVQKRNLNVLKLRLSY